MRVARTASRGEILLGRYLPAPVQHAQLTLDVPQPARRPFTLLHACSAALIERDPFRFGSERRPLPVGVARLPGLSRIARLMSAAQSARSRSARCVRLAIASASLRRAVSSLSSRRWRRAAKVRTRVVLATETWSSAALAEAPMFERLRANDASSAIAFASSFGRSISADK